MKVNTVFKIFIVICFLLPLIFSCRDTQAKTSKGPHITFEKTEVDLGKIPQKGKFDFSFKFKNTGKETLKISSVKSSCGCTIVEKGTDTLQPGESSEIKGAFYSNEYKGRLVRAISVKSNDPDKPQVILYINSVVEEPAN